MIVAISRTLKQFEHCLIGLGVLYWEQAIDLVHVKKALTSFAKLSPTLTIRYEQNVSFIRTDDLISDITLRAAGIDRSSFIEKSDQFEQASLQ